MKIKIAILLIFAAIPNMGCNNTSKDFEMSVEKVEELKGFILKGIAISGTVKIGCIANDDVYIVKRDGEKILETTTRILAVFGKEGIEFVPGDNVSLYIPDAKKEDVQVGDVVTASKTSCK
jgi:translation elongation factor EF-Tu-like GTPase